MKKSGSEYFALKDVSILIVEDNESELEELEELFGVYFKECFTAKDGKEGVEKFIQNRPDMVLTDLAMPVFDGFEMAKRIREIDKKVPIVLHTILADNDVFLKAISHKISGYVIKPTNSTLLLDILLKEYKNILKDREIKKEKMLMQAILEEFPDPIMVVDLNQNVLFANNQLKKTPYWEENSCMKCHKVLHGYDVKCSAYGHSCDSKIVMKTGKNRVSIHENIDENGNSVYINIKTVPIKDENENIYAVLKVAQDKTDDMNREKELRRMANYDTLTNLPNRTLLFDRLEHTIGRSKRSGVSFAVLFIDLDEFKSVNDIYGHSMGDKLLKMVSYRMKSSIRKIDTIARFGGDEFVIILEDIYDVKNVARVAEGILSKFKESFKLREDVEISTGCSIGIEIFNPKTENKTKETLLQNADVAMYEAKKSGKNRFYFFQDSLNDG
jgi:diguanylate cyclase (GGDEF)-like protein